MIRLIEAVRVLKPETLYFLSDKNLDNQILEPRIPSNTSTRRGDEQNTINRVCFAPTIQKCLRALPQPRVKLGSEFYVHIPEGKFTVYKPFPSEVADSVVTDEHWICEPVKVKCIGRIKINNKYDSGEIFSYKGEYFVVYDWNYWFYKIPRKLPG